MGIGDRPITDEGQRRAIRLAFICTVGIVVLGGVVVVALTDPAEPSLTDTYIVVPFDD